MTNFWQVSAPKHELPWLKYLCQFLGHLRCKHTGIISLLATEACKKIKMSSEYRIIFIDEKNRFGND